MATVFSPLGSGLLAPYIGPVVPRTPGNCESHLNPYQMQQKAANDTSLSIPEIHNISSLCAVRLPTEDPLAPLGRSLPTRLGFYF